MSSLTVLKFGSSVLRTPADLPVAVHEIYGELREHRKVIAAVSAFEGVTNNLFAEAADSAFAGDPYAVARHVATGEQQTAAELATALNQAGIPARVAEPADIGLCAVGEPLDSSPCALDAGGIAALLRETAVLVVPGFYGCDAAGRTLLFGRGGTDFTALYLAQQLNAFCRLVKDVDGIYESDPAKSATLPPRFSQVSWRHALEVGGHLVQPRALRFAQEHSQTFAVGASAHVDTTVVGPGPNAVEMLSHSEPRVRVVLLGLGTVGFGVYRYLAQRPDLFDVRRIAVRNLDKPRDGIAHELLTTDIRAAIAEPADLIIEAIGGVDPAAEAVETALRRGRTVVTANKALIAARWSQLAPFMSAANTRANVRTEVGVQQRQLRFSAAVGGAVPVLEVIEALQHGGKRIESLRMVINGTCNFVIDEMAQGATLAAAVAEAQNRGFAEMDPRSDLSAEDAAYKLAILAHAAFGGEFSLEHIDREGIEKLTPADLRSAQAKGLSLRLVASAARPSASASSSSLHRPTVKPTELPAADFLAGARNEENRVEIYTATGECIRLAGKGAGRWPTAVAVMGDVYAHLRAARASIIAIKA